MKGVIVGKFYPFHKGHKYLIEEALKSTKDLHILVVHNKFEHIAGSIKSQWIREVFPHLSVVVIEDIYDNDNSEKWADYTIEALGFKPDIVFTSEYYGDAYAYYLNCKHKQIDLNRKSIQISATKIRNEPYKYWDYLTEGAKPYYAMRICIIGAESTGTTTLAKALAKEYKTSWVPEYGRSYYEAKMYSEELENWSEKEFSHIAHMQNKIEDELAKTANKILFCDTNSFTTLFWMERYMNQTSKRVESFSKNRNYALYILTDIDIPFEQDGTRSDIKTREKMHKKMLKVLSKQNLNYLVASGSIEDRLNLVKKEIAKLGFS